MANPEYRNRQQYPPELRREILAYADNNTVVEASTVYKVPVATVYRWRRLVHRHSEEQEHPKRVLDLNKTIDRTLREINRVLAQGQGESKPHEWLSKLTDQVDKLTKLYQTMTGSPTKITEDRQIHHATVDDRISRYLEAITERRDYIDADTTES